MGMMWIVTLTRLYPSRTHGETERLVTVPRQHVVERYEPPQLKLLSLLDILSSSSLLRPKNFLHTIILINFIRRLMNKNINPMVP